MSKKLILPHLDSDQWDKRKLPPNYIQEIKITALIGGGLNHALYIRSGGFEFTGNFDNNLHNFYAVVSAAIKFFGVKYAQITVDTDGTARPTNEGMSMR